MKLYKGRFIAAVLILLVVLAISAATAQTVIPRGTVIPVTMDKALNSATSRVGGTFYAHHTGVNGGGFPEDTRFTGNVDSVTRASGRTAGQIGVSFVGARLPDGTRVPIVGQLTSLDGNSVTTDSGSGRLVATADAKKANLKFAAIGAGAGLVLGQVIGKKPLIGTILGAAAGYLYGAKVVKPAVGRDVQVPAGSGFGILLAEDVTVPGTYYTPSTASTGAGPIGAGWQVTFTGPQPVMSGNELMVPLRSVMDSIQVPFDYDSATRQISVNNYETQTLQTVGTRNVSVNGRNSKLDAPSRMMNGSIYVPASFIELVTGRSAYWNQKSGVLRIE